MAKTAPLAEISLKYVELSEAHRSRAVTVVFHFPGVCKLKTYCFVLYKVVTANSGVVCIVL